MKKEIQKMKQLKNMLFDKKDKSLTRETLKNSTYSLGTSIISKAGSLIFTILLARLVIPEMFGLYSLALSIVLTIATFTDLGLSSTLSRYLADSLAKGKSGEAEARSRLRFLLKIKISLVFIASLLIFLLAPLISNLIFHRVGLTIPLQIGALYLFAMGLQSSFGAVFFPLRKIKYTLYSEIIFQVLRIGIFVILIQLYKSVSSILASLTLAMLASALFYITILISKNKNILFGNIIPVERRKMTLFWGWAILLSSSLVLFGHVDTFMLGFFVADNFIGYYSIILGLVGSVAAFITFSSVFLPIFTQIKEDQLRRGFAKIIKYSVILAIPAAVGLAFVILPLIRIIYGAEYAPLNINLALGISSALLCLLIIEGTFTATLNSLFMAKNKIKAPAILLLIVTIANVILNVILVKLVLPFGQEWALIAVSLATVLTRYANLFILGYLTLKKFNLRIQNSDILKPIIASLVMLGFLFAFNYLFSPKIIGSGIMILLAAGVYFLFLACLNLIKS